MKIIVRIAAAVAIIVWLANPGDVVSGVCATLALLGALSFGD